MKARRVVVGTFGTLAGLALLLVLAVLVLTQTDWGRERVRRRLVAAAEGRSAARVRIGGLDGNLLRQVTLTDVAVTDSAGAPLLTTRRMRAEFGLWDILWRRRVHIAHVRLERPVIVLDKRPGERWNFQRLAGPKRGSGSGRPSRWTSISLRDVRLVDARVVYRDPWAPDSALSPASRDSAVAQALGRRTRTRVERVGAGFQRVVEWEQVGGVIARLRFRHPDSASVLIAIDSLSGIGHPYNPPAVTVRRLAGTFEATRDSLWWRDATLRLPGTRVAASGGIGFRGGTRLALRADTISLADLQWLRPTLPAEGTGRLSLRIDDPKGAPAIYEVRGLSLAVGRATAAGDLLLEQGDTTFIRSADLRVADLSTALVRRIVPEADIPREGTISGTAKVSGRLDALRTDARLAFTEAATGRTSRVAAVGELGVRGGVRARDLKLSFDPLHVALVRQPSRAFPLGGTLAGEATVNGSLRDGWRVAGDLAHAEGAERSRVAGTAAVTLRGGKPATVAADVRALPVSLATVGRLVPDLGLRGSVTGPVRVDGRPGDLRVRGDVVARAPGGGSARVRGSGRVAGGASAYDVVADLSAFDPSRLTRKAPAARLTGTVSARGTGTTPATARAEIAGRLTDSRVRDVVVDALVVRGGVAAGVARVDTLVVTGRGLRATASGTIGLVEGRTGALSYAASSPVEALRPWLPEGDTSTTRARTMGGTRAAEARRVVNVAAAAALDSARIECLALSRLGCPGESEVKAAMRGVAVASLPARAEPAGLRGDSLGGRVATSGTLRGSIKDLDASGTLAASRVVAMGSAADTVAATYAVADLFEDARLVTVSARAAGLTVRGVSLDSAMASGTWREGSGRVDARVVQDERHDYALRGAYAIGDGAKVFTIDTAAARLDRVSWFTERAARVRLERSGFAVDSLRARSTYGARLSAHGAVSDARPGVLEATLEQVRLADVMALAGRDEAVAGTADASARVEGLASAPRVRAQVNVNGARLDGRPPVSATATGGYQDGRIGASVDVSIGERGARRALIAQGFVPADLTLAGVPKLVLHRDRPMQVDARLDSLDLAALPVSHEEARDPRGLVTARAAVRGTLNDPDVAGSLALRDGSFHSDRLGIRPRNVAADLRLARDTLWLDSLRLTSGGVLRVSGTVARPLDPANASLDLRVAARELLATNTGERSVRADADLAVRGAPESVRVTGGFTMREGFLDLDGPSGDLIRLDAPGSPRLFAIYDTSGAAIAPGRDTVGPHVDIRVRILRQNFYRASPDASFQFFTERPIRGRLEPGLGGWAEGVDSPQDGVIDIGRGITVFRSRAFRMARGSISLVPQPGGRTVIFLEGERETWLPGHGWVRTRILTSGDGRAPRLSLQSASVFPMRAPEVSAHLSLGRTPLSLLQQSGSPLTGEATWSGQLGGEAAAMARRQQRSTALGMVVYEMGHGVRQSLGTDIFTVGPPDVATELAPRRIGGFRGTIFEVGQFYGLHTFAAAQVRPTWALPGLRVEHWLAPSLKVDAGFEPRFFLRGPWWDPSDRHPARAGAFGAFLTKEWGF